MTEEERQQLAALHRRSVRELKARSRRGFLLRQQGTFFFFLHLKKSKKL